MASLSQLPDALQHRPRLIDLVGLKQDGSDIVKSLQEGQQGDLDLVTGGRGLSKEQGTSQISSICSTLDQQAG